MRPDCNASHLTAVVKREESIARFFNTVTGILELLTPLIAMAVEKVVAKETE